MNYRWISISLDDTFGYLIEADQVNIKMKYQWISISLDDTDPVN